MVAGTQVLIFFHRQASGLAGQDSTGGPKAPDVREVHPLQADDQPLGIIWKRFASGNLWALPLIVDTIEILATISLLETHRWVHQDGTRSNHVQIEKALPFFISIHFPSDRLS